MAVVADLYFASNAEVEEGESRIYAVRTAEGKTERFSAEAEERAAEVRKE